MTCLAFRLLQRDYGDQARTLCVGCVMRGSSLRVPESIAPFGSLGRWNPWAHMLSWPAARFPLIMHGDHFYGMYEKGP